MPPPAHDTFAAFMGSDWAAAQPEGCRQAAGAAQREGCQLAPTPAALDAGGTTLRTRGHRQPVAVCLALHKGPLVCALRTDDLLVLFPIQPLPWARYREACTPSRAKEDPRDAALQRALRRTPRDKLQPLPPHSPPRRALAPLVAHRRRVVGAHVRMTHRLPRTLQYSCPQGLHGFEEKETDSFCDFLRRWPPRNAAPRARRTTLEPFFRAPHVRAENVIAQRRHAIKAAPPLTTAEGVITPHALVGPALVAPRRVTVQAIADFDPAIAPRAQRPPDCPLCQALPGAGPVCAPRLLGACGAPRARSASAAARQKDVGLAPGTARRGKKSWGHWRLPCPQCLRHTLVAWAAASSRPAGWAQLYSQQQRAQGTAHHAAVRALACTGIRSLLRGWQDRTPYDASVSLPALTHHGSARRHNLVECS